MKLPNGMETSIDGLGNLDALDHMTYSVFVMAIRYRGKIHAR